MALLLISLNTAAIKAESKADLRPLFPLLLQHVFAFHPQLQRQRRRDVDGGNGTDRHADQHRQREALQHRATEDVQHQHHHQGGPGSHQRTAQRLGQRHVHDFVRRTAADLAEVLTNTVRDHDAVVQRVTDNRHQGRDDGQVNLDVEQRQHAQRDDHVVRQRDNRPSARRHSKRKPT